MADEKTEREYAQENDEHFDIEIWHDEQYDALRPELRKKALEILRAEFDSDTKSAIIKAYSEHGADWWNGYHFNFGIAVRNALRSGGIKDDLLRTGNLDDYWVALTEAAVGLRLENHSPEALSRFASIDELEAMVNIVFADSIAKQKENKELKESQDIEENQEDARYLAAYFTSASFQEEEENIRRGAISATESPIDLTQFSPDEKTALWNDNEEVIASQWAEDDSDYDEEHQKSLEVQSKLRKLLEGASAWEEYAEDILPFATPDALYNYHRIENNSDSVWERSEFNGVITYSKPVTAQVKELREREEFQRRFAELEQFHHSAREQIAKLERAVFVPVAINDPDASKKNALRVSPQICDATGRYIIEAHEDINRNGAANINIWHRGENLGFWGRFKVAWSFLFPEPVRAHRMTLSPDAARAFQNQLERITIYKE